MTEWLRFEWHQGVPCAAIVDLRDDLVIWRRMAPGVSLQEKAAAR